MRNRRVKTIVAMLLAMIMMTIPVCAKGAVSSPMYGNIAAVRLTISFDKNNTVYCGLVVTPYPHCSGISGMMKLYDGNNNCLAVWPVSDYERPFADENTYPGTYGETYVVTFTGYAYSNNGTTADRLDMSIEGKCVDAN